MPRKTCATLLALVALAAASAVPTASAATTETSSNWAGYAVRKRAIRFRHVTATWVQKAVDCSTSTSRATTSGGHVGTIADPLFSAAAIDLATGGGGGDGSGPSRFARDRGTSSTATPSGLSASGSSFTATYRETTDQVQQNGNVGQMPGGFQGGPPPGAFSG